MRLSFPDRWATLNSPIHRLDPRAKLLSVFLAILIVVSEPRSELWPYAGYFGLLVLIWLLSRVPPSFALSRILFAAPFVLAPALLLPLSASWGGAPQPAALGASLALRSYAALLLMTLLIASSRVSDVLAAMRSLGLPDSFCLLCSMSYRYLSLLALEQQRVRRAMELRLPDGFRSARAPCPGFPANIPTENRRGSAQQGSPSVFGALRPGALALYGNLAALTFMRSWDRAQLVHAAMLARGFDGRFRSLVRPSLRAHDIGAALAFVGAFLAVRVLA